MRVLDNFSFGKREWVAAVDECISGDICDIEVCRTACHGAVGVFHLAAMSRAGPSVDAIDFCTQQNVVGTQNILIAAREARVRKVVYSGSSTYYGNRPPPHGEAMAPNYLNFYALSKSVGEQYCIAFDEMFDVPIVILRYFNVYGPNQPEEGAYALVLGKFLHRWAQGKDLEIHGTGEQRRDFVHVSDVAKANIAAFESDQRRRIFNVGSGTNISVKELADLISANQVFVERRPGDADNTLADITAIKAALGWEPEVSFEAGLGEMMALMQGSMASV